MVGSVAEAGKNVKTITDHHKPAALGRKGYRGVIEERLDDQSAGGAIAS